jgi:hypothetical protein
MTRRAFARGLVVALIAWPWAPTALAIGPSAEVAFVLASADNQPLAGAWTRLFREVATSLAELTSILISPEVREVPLRSAVGSTSPLVIVPLDRLPSEDATVVADALRPFLSKGGTVWFLNGAAWNSRDAVNEWVRRVVEGVRPRLALTALPAEAVVYRSFFDLKGPEVGQLEGARLEGRWAVLHAPVWTPSEQRAVGAARRRLAVNVVEYALCGDYKDEQTHLDYLLKRKRWKLD